MWKHFFFTNSTFDWGLISKTVKTKKTKTKQKQTDKQPYAVRKQITQLKIGHRSKQGILNKWYSNGWKTPKEM